MWPIDVEAVNKNRYNKFISSRQKSEIDFLFGSEEDDVLSCISKGPVVGSGDCHKSASTRKRWNTSPRKAKTRNLRL